MESKLAFQAYSWRQDLGRSIEFAAGSDIPEPVGAIHGTGSSPMTQTVLYDHTSAFDGLVLIE